MKLTAIYLSKMDQIFDILITLHNFQIKAGEKSYNLKGEDKLMYVPSTPPIMMIYSRGVP